MCYEQRIKKQQINKLKAKLELYNQAFNTLKELGELEQRTITHDPIIGYDYKCAMAIFGREILKIENIVKRFELIGK